MKYVNGTVPGTKSLVVVSCLCAAVPNQYTQLVCAQDTTTVILVEFQEGGSKGERVRRRWNKQRGLCNAAKASLELSSLG